MTGGTTAGNISPPAQDKQRPPSKLDTTTGPEEERKKGTERERERQRGAGKSLSVSLVLPIDGFYGEEEEPFDFNMDRPMWIKR